MRNLPPWKPRQVHEVDYSDPWTLSEAEIVGRVVIAFNQLEHMLYLTQTRMKAIRWQDYWTPKGHRTPVEQKVQMLRNIHLQVYGKPLSRKWDRLLREVDEITIERNSIVHSLWCVRRGKKERRQRGDR
jgi:hypothetical protein